MRGFVFTLDVLLAMLLVLSAIAILPHYNHRISRHDLGLMANTLLAAADANGTLQDVVTSQSDAQDFIDRLHTFSQTIPYCGHMYVYRVRANNIQSSFDVMTNGCSAPTDALVENYTTYRTVLYNDNNPPSGRVVYGVRLILWVEPS